MQIKIVKIKEMKVKHLIDILKGFNKNSIVVMHELDEIKEIDESLGKLHLRSYRNHVIYKNTNKVVIAFDE